MPVTKDTAPEPTAAAAKEPFQVRFNIGVGIPADQLPFVGVDPNSIRIPSEVGGQPFTPDSLKAALTKQAELEAKGSE